MTADPESLHSREAQFHDHWADSTRVEDVRVDEAFTAPTALENRYILEVFGPLQGRRLLDVGAGLGESSVMFAKLGADVTATDLSPHMMDFAARLARHHGVEIRTVVTPAETLDFPEASFDLVYVANTIHHLADRPAFLAAVARVLKPGGIFCSWDPVKYNPVINLYRRMATDVRTPDEAPLGRADVALAQRYFRDVRTRHFWLLGLALFGKYFLIDRVHPNADRYWKRIYGETDRSLWWWKPLNVLDRLLTRIPGLRWLGWNLVMVARK